MPRVDELIESLGIARFITTLDLAKAILAGSLVSRVKGEDGLFHPRRFVAVPYDALWSVWSPSNIPTLHGSGLAATSSLCKLSGIHYLLGMGL